MTRQSTKQKTSEQKDVDVLRVDYGRLLPLNLAGSEKKSTKTIADELRLYIADEITSGRLAPGTRLDEVQLAERFNISRTPVREALKQLNTIGLVVRGVRRTMTVAEVTPKQIGILFELMGELEAACVRLAVVKMTAEERAQLEKQHETCRILMKIGDADGYAKANAVFHSLIYAGCHNEYLIDAAHQVRVRLSPFRRAQFHASDRMTKSSEEHEFILRAILRGDQMTAMNVMRDHIAAAQEAYGVFSASVKQGGGPEVLEAGIVERRPAVRKKRKA